MAENTQLESRVNESAGHLSVHVAGMHPSSVIFSFEQRSSRMLPSFFSAGVLQVAIFMTFVLLSRYGPTLITTTPELPPDDLGKDIVWIYQEGPGGGGGGGGNRQKEPPRPVEAVGKDKISVPVQKPVVVEPKPKQEEPPQMAQVNIPAVDLGASTVSLPGLIDAPAGPATTSTGSGSGGGSGTGTGTGIGSGTGSGLGDGSGGGTGGGVYQPGSLDRPPRIIRQVPPKYTSDAMRARIQGKALVACIVEPSGVPTNCRISKSLDRQWGLDQMAIDAALQWRFSPSTYKGMPVRVDITIEMDFGLR